MAEKAKTAAKDKPAPKKTKPRRKRKLTLQIEHMDLDGLKEHPRNESIREHPAPGSQEWKALVESMKDDYFDPIVWNKLNGFLVSGHLRRKVALSLGFRSADISVVEYDEDRHLARMIAANKSVGDWIDDELEGLLKELDGRGLNMGLTGHSDKELNRMLKEVEDLDAQDDDEETVTEKEMETFLGMGTAMKRDSLPIQFWKEKKLLKGDVLDFGSGNEKHEFAKYDAKTHPGPEALTKEWDVVMSNYVLNVIPVDHLIIQTLALLKTMTKKKGKLLIAVRSDMNPGLHRTARGIQNIKTLAAWRQLLSVFFEIKEAKDEGSFFAFVCIPGTLVIHPQGIGR